MSFGILLLTLSISSIGTASVLPQVSQEGLLRPYRSYADVTLFHYYLPEDVSRATFQFAAFMDSPKCHVRTVFIHLQHGSYPVMSPDNATYPPKLVVDRESMHVIWLNSSFDPHDPVIYPVYNPLPGSWFAAAYLPDWDQSVQQEGLGHKCQYSLGSIALWSQVAAIESIPLRATVRLSSQEHFTYYKFYIPSGIFSFRLRFDSCTFHTLRRFYENGGNEIDSRLTTTQEHEDLFRAPCLKNIFLRGRALPTFDGKIKNNSLKDESSIFDHSETLPFTDSYYYLLIVAESKVSYNVTIEVEECPLQILGKTFIQHFSGVATAANLKEQAVGVNYTLVGDKDMDKSGGSTCNCIPIYRLTRIKHSMDFSDTFLLEGKEWFTSWLRLSDRLPAGASFEILPFIDIGGTLSIGFHMDELLINATSQEIRVNGCVRKSRPPPTFCCNSTTEGDCCPPEYSIKVISQESRVDDYILIPFPEPDIWFISFSVSCHDEDGVVVPCDHQEILISLDVRTQPCVLTKPTKPGGRIQPCGKYGVCQEVHRGQFFYTSCKCIGGYRGWACTDDSEATPSYILWLNVFLLTLSNLFFIPAIFLSMKRRHYVHVLVYFSTMASSTLYHACDQELYGYCLTRYAVLQFCDFFCSILALWVTLVSLAKSSPKHDSALYMLGAIVIAIGVEYNRTGLLVLAVPFILGILIPLSYWGYRSYQIRSLIVPKLNAILLFLPGVFLGATGLLLYAFVETEENYRYTHSAWHAIIALSLVYLLPKRKKRKGNPNSADQNNSGGTTQENGSVNSGGGGGGGEELEGGGGGGGQGNPGMIPSPGELPNSVSSQSNSSPVFFITSDLDHLVQDREETR